MEMKTADLYICNMKLGEVPHIAGVLTDTDVININHDVLNTADIIELRVDLFGKLTTEHIEMIFKLARDKFKKPLIGTIRSIKEGGQKEIPDRLGLYRTIIPLSDMVDVEIGSDDIIGEIGKICIEDKKLLIGSYHNFDSTPGDDMLDKIVSKGKSLGADIVKIAVTAEENDDVVRLAVFTNKHRDEGLITISMGDRGLSSRIFSPLFGSLITYGYVTHPSAPGQLSVSELLYIFRRLKVR